MKRHNATGIILTTTLITFMLIYVVSFLPVWTQNSQVQAGNSVQNTFTVEELKKYSGDNISLPIYLAFEGKVYDVTAGKKFYEPGGAYHYLAGTDATSELHIAGGGIIKSKYPVVGIVAGLNP